jgi:tetratricopeptide (TPR) repeat protein
MSSEAEVRAAAEAAWRQKQWKDAVPHYAELLEIVYDAADDLTLQVCLDLLRYSECLIEANDEANKEEDLEIAWDCLEHARVSLEKLPAESVPGYALPDVHEFLATVAMRNFNIPEAVRQYDAITDIARAKPDLSWRIGLNALYMSALALGLTGAGLGRLDQAIAFLRDRIDRSADAPDLADMQSIYAEFLERRAQIPQ